MVLVKPFFRVENLYQMSFAAQIALPSHSALDSLQNPLIRPGLTHRDERVTLLRRYVGRQRTTGLPNHTKKGAWSHRNTPVDFPFLAVKAFRSPFFTTASTGQAYPTVLHTLNGYARLGESSLKAANATPRAGLSPARGIILIPNGAHALFRRARFRLRCPVSLPSRTAEESHCPDCDRARSIPRWSERFSDGYARQPVLVVHQLFRSRKDSRCGTPQLQP